MEWILIVVLAGAGYVLLGLWRQYRYEEAVRKILNEMECPLFSIDIVERHYHKNNSPDAAASEIIERWEGWHGKSIKGHGE